MALRVQRDGRQRVQRAPQPTAADELRRRQQWDSAAAAFAHFAAKPAFARWAPGMLRDYIASGTETQGKLRRVAEMVRQFRAEHRYA